MGIKSDSKEKSFKADSFSMKSVIKMLLPHFLKSAIRKIPLEKNVDHNILAFRVFLIKKMYHVLNEDCSEKVQLWLGFIFIVEFLDYMDTVRWLIRYIQ